MTEADVEELSALSEDAPFREAVKTLSRNATAVVAIHRREEFFDNLSPPPGSFLGDAVAGFFLNGGVRCYIARATPPRHLPGGRRHSRTPSTRSPLTDLDLVAVPDVMLFNITTDDPGRDAANPVPDMNAIMDVQAYALLHCAKNTGGSPSSTQPPGRPSRKSSTQRDGLALRADEPVNGALYYPGSGPIGRSARPAVRPRGGHLRAHGRARRRLQGAGQRGAPRRPRPGASRRRPRRRACSTHRRQLPARLSPGAASASGARGTLEPRPDVALCQRAPAVPDRAAAGSTSTWPGPRSSRTRRAVGAHPARADRLSRGLCRPARSRGRRRTRHSTSSATPRPTRRSPRGRAGRSPRSAWRRRAPAEFIVVRIVLHRAGHVPNCS